MITARMSASDWGLLLLLSLIWGGSFFLIALIVGHMPVLWVVALRVMIAAAVLWAIVLATGRALPRGAGLWGAFLVMGVLNNAIPFGLIVWAQGFIPAGLASILNATTPLFTVLVSTLVLADERAGLMRLAGVALGWYLRRTNDWCAHCGDQLSCEGCGSKAAWPKRQVSEPLAR